MGRCFGVGCTVHEAARQPLPPWSWPTATTALRSSTSTGTRPPSRTRATSSLAYDHRNFGDSDGEPRQELHPWMAGPRLRNAITFVQTLDGVDPERIGIWDTSYAGGHVLVVAAIDAAADRAAGAP